MTHNQYNTLNEHRHAIQPRIMLETGGGDRLHAAEAPRRLLQRIDEVASRLGLDPLPLPMWFEPGTEGAAA